MTSSIGIILARGLSRRLPRKNVKPLLGTPLIGYVIAAARASRLDRVIVSTEDMEIAEIARKAGADVPFARPAKLAEDYASDEDIVLHALDWIAGNEGRTYDIAVKIQPTTPFVLPGHIDQCIETVAMGDAACCFTARKVSEPPQWMFTADEDGCVNLLLGGTLDGEAEHTQLLPPVYFPTGAAYAVRVAELRTQGRIFADPMRVTLMEPERSVDIDDDIDWALAELIARKHGFAPNGGTA